MVMLAVSTNLVPERDFQRMVVLVDDKQSGVLTQEFFPSEVSFPWTLALRAADPDGDQKYAARVRVLLARNSGGSEIVVASRDVEVVLPAPEVQQMVHVSIDWLSMYETKFQQLASVTQGVDLSPFVLPGDVCSETTTPNALGQCVALAADQQGEFDRKIEPYDPALIFGGGSSPTEGSSCWQATACMQGGTQVVARRSGGGGACVAELLSGVTDRTSLAVLTASTANPDVTRCGGVEGCGDDLGSHGRGVVLDREVLSFSGRTVTLPSKVCERFPDGAKILVGEACPKKERSIPLCPAAGVQLGRVGTPRQIGP